MPYVHMYDNVYIYIYKNWYITHMGCNIMWIHLYIYIYGETEGEREWGKARER